MRTFAVGAALCAGALLAACTPDGSEATPDDTEPDEPTISVTVPVERLTPFCEAMIDLSDQLRAGGVEDANALIIETYRSIQPDVPLEIVIDFDQVLAALEAGLPPPTDPPIETTIATSAPPTTGFSAAPTEGPASADGGSVDEGFDPDTSPTDRINSYVAFSCRSTGNNPGPPATQPGDLPAGVEEESSS